MTKTNNVTDHALMTPGSIILILENLANELTRDARITGRDGDLRPQALLQAARTLRETGCMPGTSDNTPLQASGMSMGKMLDRALQPA